MGAASMEQMLTDTLGTRGRWQWNIFLVACLGPFFAGMHSLGVVFLAATPDHWCAVPGLHKNSSDEVWDALIPKEVRNGRLQRSQCHRFSHWNLTQLKYWNQFNSSDFPSLLRQWNLSSSSDNTLIRCDFWEYDKSVYSSTITTQWNLVCEYTALVSTVQATYMAGNLAGNVLITLSDRFGRRPILMTSLFVYMAATICTAFASHYIAFITFRFFIAMAGTAVYQLPFILLTEISVLPKRRSLFGILYCVPFAIGYMLLPGIAYWLRNWIHLQLAISLPSILLLLYLRIIPESPRWLICRGRYGEALAILKTASRLNGCATPSDEEILVTMQAIRNNENKIKDKQKKFFLSNLCRTKEMMKRTSISYFSWFTVSVTYYGLALHVPKLSSNQYLGFFLAGVVEIPAYVISTVLISSIGRRPCFSVCFFVGGMACLAILFIPEDSVAWLPMTLAVTGKFLITAAFSIAYLFTAELFPTVIRAVAVGSSSMCARFGSISAPYIVDLLGNYHSRIPLVVFGSLSLMAGLLSLFLPETNKAQLNETVEDIEDNVELKQLNKTTPKDQ